MSRADWEQEEEELRRERKKPPFRGSWRMLVLAGALFLVAGVVLLLCNLSPHWSRFFCRLADWLRRGLSTVFSVTRFPVAQLLIPGAALLALVTLVRALFGGLRRLARWCSNFLCAAAALSLMFILVYGVCYTAPDLASELGYEVRPYNQNELAYAMHKTVDMMNNLAPLVERDAEGAVADPDFDRYAQAVMDSYAELAEDCPRFAQTAGVPPKQARLIGVPMSHLRLAGFFFPWTSECLVGGNVYPTDVAFNAAHEAGHSMGIGPEDACNFAGFLCLMNIEDPGMRYSGALHAFIYLNNALYSQDYDLWYQVNMELADLPRRDIQLRNAHLHQYDGPANQIGEKVNDTYIKATGQPDGVRSYGKVSDLLIAYFLEH